VAVFFAEVVDVGAGGFEDAETQQAQHRDEHELISVGRFAGGGQRSAAPVLRVRAAI
jgi:hypothetical protein